MISIETFDNLLENENYQELKNYLSEIKEVPQEESFAIFDIILHKYSILEENNLRKLEEIFFIFISSMDLSERFYLLAKAFNDEYSIKAVHFVLTYLIGTLQNASESEQNQAQDLVPTLFSRLKKNFDHGSERLILCMDYVDLFQYSNHDSIYLLEEFMSTILFSLSIKEKMINEILEKCWKIRLKLGEKLKFNLLLLAEALIYNKIHIPLVYSSEYLLELCVSAFIRDVQVEMLGRHSIEIIQLCFIFCLTPIDDKTILRDALTKFVPFFDKILRIIEILPQDSLRKILMDLFRLTVNKFEEIAQLLIIRRFILFIKENKLKLNNEASVLAWLLDEYRYFLRYNNYFQDELGYIWADLSAFRYKELEETSSYFISILLLMQYQALHRINKKLMLNVKEKILNHFHDHLCDFTSLINMSKVLNSENHLSLLQFTYQQTEIAVNEFLNDLPHNFPS